MNDTNTVIYCRPTILTESVQLNLTGVSHKAYVKIRMGGRMKTFVSNFN